MEITKITTKKQMKEFINDNGGFNQIEIETNKAPEGMRIPEGAKYFKGIASNSELNRNGYIIEKEAFKASIDTYMLNPVILLQHNPEQPIGKCTNVQVTSKGVEVEGLIYKSQMDEQSWTAFENGILKGLSTGHIPKHAKFKNDETGQVVDEDKIGTKGNPSWMDIAYSNAWTMIVDALDWVEFSLVTIPANMKSLILQTNEMTNDLKQNAIKNYAVSRLGVSIDQFTGDEDDDSLEESSVIGGTQVGKNDIQDTPEESAEPTTEDGSDDEESEKTDETTVTATESANEEVEEEEVKQESMGDPEDSDESEVSEEEEEGETVTAIESELKEMTKSLATNILKIEKELGKKESVSINEVKDEITAQLEKNNQEVSQVMTTMATTIETLSKKVEGLESQLSKIAVNKPLIIHAPLENSQEKTKSRWA